MVCWREKIWRASRLVPCWRRLIYCLYLLGLTSTAYTAGSVAFSLSLFRSCLFYCVFLLTKTLDGCKNHKLTTLADYARERFDSKLLSSLIAIVGVLMLIPYICLQLSGIQDTLTVAGTSYINVNAVVMISFILVALYTFFSGIKGPTYTAIIKDILVWVIMLFMVVSLPIIHFNGWTPMMNTLAKEAPQLLTIPESGPKGILWFITASGVSALALFMWAHAATGVFTAKSADAIRKTVCFTSLQHCIDFGHLPWLHCLFSLTGRYKSKICSSSFNSDVIWRRDAGACVFNDCTCFSHSMFDHGHWGIEFIC